MSKIRIESESQLGVMRAILSTVVYRDVKDTNWKRITTNSLIWTYWVVLFIVMSKIRIESESQPLHSLPLQPLRCLSWCQRYELKANHNLNSTKKSTCLVVYRDVKDTNWKRITTKVLWLRYSVQLFIVMSKIRIESESQRIIALPTVIISCLSWCQRYELKANHNVSSRTAWELPVVYRDVKDTNWKRITTIELSG